MASCHPMIGTPGSPQYAGSGVIPRPVRATKHRTTTRMNHAKQARGKVARSNREVSVAP